MKLSYVLFAFLSLIVKPFPVLADRMITFYFGNTVDLSAGLTCTENDKILMAPIFNISYYKNRRQLRSVFNNATTTHIDDRGLQGNECKNRCEGYTGGYCHPMPICNKKRRALQDTFNPLYATCPNHLAEVNRRLDALIATSTDLSANCKILIRTDNRNATCEDGIIVGEIASFTIVRIDARKWVADKCKGFPPNYCPMYPSPPPLPVTTNDIRLSMGGTKANIEVRLIPCISTLELSVVGPGINSKRIITLTSSSSMKVSALTDYTTFSAGIYTVTAIPNNNPSKAKSFTITAV
jgi:hypothetical protein